MIGTTVAQVEKGFNTVPLTAAVTNLVTSDFAQCPKTSSLKIFAATFAFALKIVSS